MDLNKQKKKKKLSIARHAQVTSYEGRRPHVAEPAQHGSRGRCRLLGMRTERSARPDRCRRGVGSPPPPGKAPLRRRARAPPTPRGLPREDAGRGGSRLRGSCGPLWERRPGACQAPEHACARAQCAERPRSGPRRPRLRRSQWASPRPWRCEGLLRVTSADALGGLGGRWAVGGRGREGRG